MNAGEFAAIVGTPGSGKSTLLHMMGGLDMPTSGDILIGGKRLSQKSAEQMAMFHRRHIGFVFQNYNLVPILNVYENIVLPVQLDGRKADKGFLEEIVCALLTKPEITAQLRQMVDDKLRLYERYLRDKVELDAYKAETSIYDERLRKTKNVRSAWMAQAEQTKEADERRQNRERAIQEIAEAGKPLFFMNRLTRRVTELGSQAAKTSPPLGNRNALFKIVPAVSSTSPHCKPMHSPRRIPVVISKSRIQRKSRGREGV